MSYTLTPQSWIFANLAADKPLTGTTDLLNLADPVTSGSVEGPDFVWDSGTPDTITVVNDCLIAVSMVPSFRQSADADGMVLMNLQSNVDWPSPAGSALSWLDSTGYFACRPCAGTTAQLDFGYPITLPLAWVQAGGILQFAALENLVAGSCTLRAVTGVSVTRVA